MGEAAWEQRRDAISASIGCTVDSDRKAILIICEQRRDAISASIVSTVDSDRKAILIICEQRRFAPCPQGKHKSKSPLASKLAGGFPIYVSLLC